MVTSMLELPLRSSGYRGPTGVLIELVGCLVLRRNGRRRLGKTTVPLPCERRRLAPTPWPTPVVHDENQTCECKYNKEQEVPTMERTKRRVHVRMPSLQPV